MAKILVVGSINMDLVLRVPHSPVPGETILGSNFQTFPGGKGANQAVAAARMGGEVTLIGKVGNDDFGKVLTQGLVENKVITDYVVKDPDARTGIAMIIVADNGENMIALASGANMNISTDDIQKEEDLFSKTNLLMAQLETPLPAMIKAVELAHAHNVLVVLDPAPAQPLPDSFLEQVDVLTPNESELAILTGEDDIDRGIKILRDRGVKNVVVTLGAKGARLVNETTDLYIPSYKVVPVDSTAAGDAFNGALAVALAEGKSLVEAAQYGMAAGALATTKSGAQPSLPTREAVERMMADPTFND